jgi:hypothetical protein
MIVTQDDDHGLIMQTMVRGQTILIDPQLISSVIGVPVLPIPRAPFPDEAPSIDFLHDFFGTRPQREDKSHSQINIGAFAPMHRFLAIVVTNIWPQARRSELTLKKVNLLYAIVMRTPFCLCKHIILHTMLEVRVRRTRVSLFGCLITQICLQVVTDDECQILHMWTP